MKRFTPTQKWNQVMVLSKLIEKPMRYSELWKAVKTHTKSKDTFGKTLDTLRKKGIVERIEKNPNHVIYRISENAEEIPGASRYLSLARRISPWGSI